MPTAQQIKDVPIRSSPRINIGCILSKTERKKGEIIFQRTMRMMLAGLRLDGAALICPLRFWNKLLDRSLLQQVSPRALLASNRTAEFCYYKAGFERFAKCPSGRFPPLSRQFHVGALDFENIAWDLDTHTLACE